MRRNIFGFEAHFGGVRVVPAGPTLTGYCRSDAEIEFAIARMKVDLGALSTAMKEALAEEARRMPFDEIAFGQLTGDNGSPQSAK